MPTHEFRTSQLLSEIANGGRSDDVLIDEVLERFNRRAFGALLLVVTLPSFLPVPVGIGAVSGPLVMLVGAQLLCLRRRPWLPLRLRQRGLKRASFAQFSTRIGPWLQRLERLSRPRLEALTERALPTMVSGALLMVVGLILALPIPLTNYPVGLLVLSYAIALIERDGALLLLAWLLGLGAAVATVLLSGEVLQGLTAWLG